MAGIAGGLAAFLASFARPALTLAASLLFGIAALLACMTTLPQLASTPPEAVPIRAGLPAHSYGGTTNPEWGPLGPGPVPPCIRRARSLRRWHSESLDWLATLRSGPFLWAALLVYLSGRYSGVCAATREAEFVGAGNDLLSALIRGAAGADGPQDASARQPSPGVQPLTQAGDTCRRIGKTV
jgi:hypothetical protein